MVFVDDIIGRSVSECEIIYINIVLVLLGRLRHSANGSVLYYYAKVLPLIYLLRISRLFFFSAFGENFGPTGASGSARPPLSSTHYGRERPCSAEGEKRSAVLSESAAQPQKVRLGL